MIAKGLGFAVVMGVLGGLLPARLAARKPVLDALRSL
jgi:ABC-type antimicrobial peptide transport system permease subunit